MVEIWGLVYLSLYSFNFAALNYGREIKFLVQKLGFGGSFFESAAAFSWCVVRDVRAVLSFSYLMFVLHDSRASKIGDLCKFEFVQ